MKVFGLEVRRPYPTKLTIDINTQCNARCVICPYPRIKNKLTHGVMDWGLYRKIIDNYAKICYSNRIMGELSYCNMSEPTLVPDFHDFIRYARLKGCFAIYFNTNGSNLTPKLVNAFVKEKTFPAIHLNILSFSKERYAEVMGLDFDSLMGNLTYLLREYPHCLIDVGFFAPLMDKREIDAVRSFFRDTKVTLHLSDNISSRAGNVDLAGNFSKFRSPTKRKIFGCAKNRPIHRMHINYDGRVYLCDQDMGLLTNFGNVRESSIEEVWNGLAMMETLRVIYGKAEPGEAGPLPCLKCEACIDNDRIKFFKEPGDFKCRSLFGPLGRWLVKKGWAVVKKRGKLALLWA